VRLYLDLESSTSRTAALLRVHRNTVLARLERARGLLPVSLDDPDDRIVVHLATRALGVEWAESESQ
jgi:DNA-binding PucR family transcriptional regulator